MSKYVAFGLEDALPVPHFLLEPLLWQHGLEGGMPTNIGT